MNLLHVDTCYIHRHENGFGSYILGPPSGLWNTTAAPKNADNGPMTKAQGRFHLLFFFLIFPS